MSAVEQIENGIVVICADGTRIVCKPLTLKAAKQIIGFSETLNDKSVDPMDRAKARLAIVRVFADLYPELAEKISPGDIEVLLPDFFWSASGASVPPPDGASTGTEPTESTAPSGASPPAST